ncbi:MAG TPA: hypothetical protein DEO86_10100 [Colwellia sp.]|nr:hypothetical protein [Colwellia sp.]
MNYTDWLQGRFSSLSHASSAETYGYIKQAKSETKFLRGFVGVAVLLAIILPSNMLLSSMGFVPFESIIYWCTFIVVVLISSALSKQAEQKIIKNKLTKIIQAKYT